MFHDEVRTLEWRWWLSWAHERQEILWLAHHYAIIMARYAGRNNLF